MLGFKTEGCLSQYVLNVVALSNKLKIDLSLNQNTPNLMVSSTCREENAYGRKKTGNKHMERGTAGIF